METTRGNDWRQETQQWSQKFITFKPRVEENARNGRKRDETRVWERERERERNAESKMQKNLQKMEEEKVTSGLGYL